MKLDEIKELMRLFGKSKLVSMKIKQKDFEVEMEKSSEPVIKVSESHSVAATPITVASTPAKHTRPTETKKKFSGETITSPMVGTLYASPSSDSPPFIKIGDQVKRGDVLCILEAMKKMNELTAEFDCQILDILVSDGEAVEYGAPLFVVEKI